ncbi:hypothetical protein, partial [Streptococcus infantarius]|uniref:hypothetical protein n=1 Tax=Streptococcus infantarius TaxID=102684 RepID=UPI0022E6CA25
VLKRHTGAFRRVLGRSKKIQKGKITRKKGWRCYIQTTIYPDENLRGIYHLFALRTIKQF